MLAIDQVKDTVRKLLNLAQDNAAAEGEIQNALNFAQKMMAKYHLSESDIPDSSSSIDQIESVDVTNMTYMQGGTYSIGASLCTWENGLGSFIARFVGSVVVYQQTKKEVKMTSHGTIDYDANQQEQIGQRMVFVGTENDVFLCESLFSEIALTISVMARIKFGGHLRGKGRAYGDGFVSSLFTKLTQNEKLLASPTNPTSNSTALVVRAANSLAIKKKNQAKVFLSSKGIRLGNVQSSQVKDYDDAYSSGKTDGSSFNANASKSNYDRDSRKRIT